MEKQPQNHRAERGRAAVATAIGTTVGSENGLNKENLKQTPMRTMRRESLPLRRKRVKAATEYLANVRVWITHLLSQPLPKVERGLWENTERNRTEACTNGKKTSNENLLSHIRIAFTRLVISAIDWILVSFFAVHL